jgi:hypothetical protein
MVVAAMNGKICPMLISVALSSLRESKASMISVGDLPHQASSQLWKTLRASP